MNDVRVAVFTILKDEPFFLRLWCNYYFAALPHADHIVVFAGEPTDQERTTISYHDVSVEIPLPGVLPDRKCWIESKQFAFAQNKTKELLQDHDIVIFTDVDEFLIPSDPRQTLEDFCAEFCAEQSRQCVRANGLGVVQQVDTEPALLCHPGELVLSNRSTMFAQHRFCKTLVLKSPLLWSAGFHHVVNDRRVRIDPPIDPKLDLCHARFIDVQQEYARDVRRQNDWGKDSDSQPFGYDMHSLEELKTLYRSGRSPWVKDTNNVVWDSHRPLAVPEHWKTLLKF